MYSALSSIADYLHGKKLAAAAFVGGIAAIAAGCGGGSGEAACNNFREALREQYNAEVVVAVKPSLRGLLVYRNKNFLDELVVLFVGLEEDASGERVTGDKVLFLDEPEDIPSDERREIVALLGTYQATTDESLFSCPFRLPADLGSQQQQGNRY